MQLTPCLSCGCWVRVPGGPCFPARDDGQENILSPADIQEAGRRSQISLTVIGRTQGVSRLWRKPRAAMPGDGVLLRPAGPSFGFRLRISPRQWRGSTVGPHQMWYVYLARCTDGSLYTGITTNPHERARRHNSGRGSKYVRAKGTATLVYVESSPNRSAAQRREREIKGWVRPKKLALIASHA